MSFTTCSTTFSTKSLGSVRTPSQQHSQCLCRCWGLWSWISMSYCLGWLCGVHSLAGMGRIQTKKETMQNLNDGLASYLDKVKSLETENRRLESKIQEHLEKKGPQGVRDWGHYFKTIEDLRAQIFANSVDNACLAIDYLIVKYETDLAIHQSVESDIHGLHKVVDDTNITRLQLETEIEARKKELLFLKKNHKEEVQGLEAQIASSGLTVEVYAPKSQDLSKIMADIHTQHEEPRGTGQVLVSANRGEYHSHHHQV